MSRLESAKHSFPAGEEGHVIRIILSQTFLDFKWGRWNIYFILANSAKNFLAKLVSPRKFWQVHMRENPSN